MEVAEAEARYVMAAYLPIRRHRRKASARNPCKAWARIPCRKASARSPCRNPFVRSPCQNAFARSRDPHHVWERCRLERKPRGSAR